MTEIFKKLSLALISILIFLALFEIALRILDYPYTGCEEIYDVNENRFAKFDEDLGWSLITNRSTPANSVTGETGFFIINEEGYRTRSLDKKTNLSKPVVMFIGCSFTFGHGVVYYNQTLTHKIEKLMDDEFEILNFGAPGYGTDQSYITMKRYFQKYKPIAVVYIFISGHDERNMIYDKREPGACLRFLGTKPLFSVENGKLVLAKKPLPYEEYDSQFRVLNFFRDHNPFKEKPKHDPYDLMKALISEMINYTEENNSKMYFINFWDSEPNFVLNDFISERGYDILDMSPFLSGGSWMVGGQGHPNEYANTLVAEKFAEKYGDELREMAPKAKININKT